MNGNKYKELARSTPLSSRQQLKNQCADNSFEQTSVCFNLALHLNFADHPRKSTLQRDYNPDRHPSNSAVNRATPVRYQSIICGIRASSPA
jgi:hypothetical protein